MPTIAPLSQGFLTLAIATLWLPSAARRRAAVGLVAFALGAASLTVGGARNPSAALDINSALLFLGVLTVAVVALTGLWRAILPVGLALLSLAMVRGALTEVSLGRAAFSAFVIAAGSALVAGVVFYSAPGRLIRWLDGRIRKVGTDEPFTFTPADLPLGGLLGLGYLAVGLGTPVGLVVSGVVAIAAAALGMGRRHRCGPGLAWFFLTAASALVLWWFLAVVAGPVGLRLSALPDVPLSPAAELAVSIPLLLTFWALLGLWPLDARVPSGLLAPAAAALFTRVGVPALPLALAHWQPLLFPVAVLATWHASATRRPAEALAAATLAALASLTGVGVTGAVWLVGVGFVSQVRQWINLQPVVAGLVDRALWLAGAWGGYLAIQAGLQAEVVYSLLMLGGIVSLLVTLPERHGVDSTDHQFHIWPRSGM